MDEKVYTAHGQSLQKTLGHFEITFLKYNGTSIFLLFQILTKMLQFFFLNSNYIALYKKTFFKTDFGPQEMLQPENA